MFSRPKILFLVSLLFVALFIIEFNPYLPFKIFNFFIILMIYRLPNKINCKYVGSVCKPNECKKTEIWKPDCPDKSHVPL